MRALILDGSHEGDSEAGRALSAATEELNKRGLTVETIALRNERLSFCKGCFGCWVKTPGICVIPDRGRDIAKSMINSDIVIFLTPVTFGGYSSTLKKAVDRIICLISPFFMKINGEVHHKPRYPSFPLWAVIGLMPHPDEESGRIFRKLVERNAINAHTTGYAVVASPGGRGGEDIRSFIRNIMNDLEAKNGSAQKSAAAHRKSEDEKKHIGGAWSEPA